MRLASLLTLALACGAFAQDRPAMVAHFIDMGQADCTLLEFPCGVAMIDAGSQDAEHTGALLAYLDAFFDERDDLGRTIGVLFITHNHIDHTSALREIVAHGITIGWYIDNGEREGTGGADQRWLVSEIAAGDAATIHREVRGADVALLGDREGLSNGDIDPISCEACDPRIRILSSIPSENPGWPPGEYANENNQSLVIRIDFGESSFLFTGDLEEPAIETLVDAYEGTGTLDVDVYHVGHHGSHNGTTASLIGAMTPAAAVISMGRWDFGRLPDGGARPFTTFAYGHPRRVVLDLLAGGIPGYRSQSKSVKAADAARDFRNYTVRKRIYATGWDKTVQVRATDDGHFRVTVNHVGP